LLLAGYGPGEGKGRKGVEEGRDREGDGSTNTPPSIPAYAPAIRKASSGRNQKHYENKKCSVETRVSVPLSKLCKTAFTRKLSVELGNRKNVYYN